MAEGGQYEDDTGGINQPIGGDKKQARQKRPSFLYRSDASVLSRSASLKQALSTQSFGTEYVRFRVMHRTLLHQRISTELINPLMGRLKPQSNSTIIGD